MTPRAKRAGQTKTIRVGDKRRLSIPKRATKSISLRKGMKLMVEVTGGIITLKPLKPV